MTMVTAGLIMGGATIISGIFGASAASKREAAARREKQAAQKKLTFLEKTRQDVINPYEGIKDLSGSINNPMANLSVATQAAEMQIEQADISLANTLDAVRSTGASAGGATALAQAALQSKKGVSASIEQQEASNEKLKAQGEATVQQLKMAEKQRVQNADVAGESFMFNTTENRQVAEMNRVAAQVSGAQGAEMQASMDGTGAITGAIGALGQIGGAMASTPAATPTTPSDRRLKKNIEKIDVSPSGLNIYSFEYIDGSEYGHGTYQGVMSNEIPLEAVVVNDDGFDGVDYSKLDVEFKKIK